MPREIPVALGSIERGDGFGEGSYVTWHAPRESGKGGWGHVLELAQGAALLERWKKPVVSDEPIGAGAAFQPGRRDDVPARFRAAALLTRLRDLARRSTTRRACRPVFRKPASSNASTHGTRRGRCCRPTSSSTERSGAAAPRAASSPRSTANESSPSTNVPTRARVAARSLGMIRLS